MVTSNRWKSNKTIMENHLDTAIFNSKKKKMLIDSWLKSKASQLQSKERLLWSKNSKLSRKEKLKVAASTSEPSQDLWLSRKEAMKKLAESTKRDGNYTCQISSKGKLKNALLNSTRSTGSLGHYFILIRLTMQKTSLMNAKKQEATNH